MGARREPAGGPTAAQCLASALGRPAPCGLTDAERRELDARQDAADTEASRLYGLPGEAAA
jgi:hypothetical protein